MATTRITVSVPAEVAARIKQAARRSRSVSEWVSSAVTRTLEEEDVRRRFLEFCDGVEATPAQEKRALASYERITRGEKGGRGKSAA